MQLLVSLLESVRVKMHKTKCCPKPTSAVRNVDGVVCGANASWHLIRPEPECEPLFYLCQGQIHKTNVVRNPLALFFSLMEWFNI